MLQRILLLIASLSLLGIGCISKHTNDEASEEEAIEYVFTPNAYLLLLLGSLLLGSLFSMFYVCMWRSLFTYNISFAESVQTQTISSRSLK